MNILYISFKIKVTIARWSQVLLSPSAHIYSYSYMHYAVRNEWEKWVTPNSNVVVIGLIQLVPWIIRLNEILILSLSPKESLNLKGKVKEM